MRVLLSMSLAASLAVACTEDPPTAATVPSQEGHQQPSGNGADLDEDEACERLRAALEAAADDLGCDAPRFSCPEQIRPLGACREFSYPESAIEACEEEIARTDSCADLEGRRCIVTAVPTSAECGVSGMGGAAGAGGVTNGGSGGSLAASGAAGEAGAGGASY